MIYFKTSQPVPGKGDALMFYECSDSQMVKRYVTFIPATGETERVPKPIMRQLYNPESLMASSREEFEKYWPPEHPHEEEEHHEEAAAKPERGFRFFDLNMSVGEAMTMHPRVSEVFAAFHLGGCTHCSINEMETVGQVCMGYGVDPDQLLEVLESLMDRNEPTQATPAP